MYINIARLRQGRIGVLAKLLRIWAPPDTYYSDNWYNDTALRQGSFKIEDWECAVFTGDAYGTIGSFRNIETGNTPFVELTGKRITSARIRLRRYSSGGSSPNQVRIWKCPLIDVPGAGAHSPNGSYVPNSNHNLGSISFSESKWFSLPVEIAEWVVAGNCLVLCYGGSNYMKLYGIENASYKPVLEITTAIDEPGPSAPVLDSIQEINTASFSFSCGISVDAGGFFDSDQLRYVLQVAPDGQNFDEDVNHTFFSDLGIPVVTVDLQEYFDLSEQHRAYFLNTLCKIRMKAVTPAWGAQPEGYTSDWSVSPAFTIDYRLTPSAPSSFNVYREGDANPTHDAFEGEQITFNFGAPDIYNDIEPDGSPIILSYFVDIGGKATVSGESGFAYEMPELTTEQKNWETSISAYCVDSVGQAGTDKLVQLFTINRFRHPSIVINSAPIRYENKATINISVTDTGYGGKQSEKQMDSCSARYTLTPSGEFGSGIERSAVLGVWGGATGLDTSFEINGLEAGKRYDVEVYICNRAPDGRSVNALRSNGYSTKILEYLPAWAGWKNPMATTQNNKATAGLSTRALVVGTNMGAAVNKDCMVVQGDIDAGGIIRSNGKSTLLLASVLPISGGNIIVADTNGNASDSRAKLNGSIVPGLLNTVACNSGASPCQDWTIDLSACPYSLSGPWHIDAIIKTNAASQDVSLYYYNESGVLRNSGFSCHLVRDGSESAYASPFITFGGSGETSVAAFDVFAGNGAVVCYTGKAIRQASNAGSYQDCSFSVIHIGTDSDITKLVFHSSSASGLAARCQAYIYTMGHA